jgi:hypothetical protein
MKINIPSWLKMFLGILVISFFHVFTLLPMLNTNSYIIKVGLGTLFWLPVISFMDWREWVRK